MRLLRFMGYPINNFSTLEASVALQLLTMREQGDTGLVAFDGVLRLPAADQFCAQAGPEAIDTSLPSPVRSAPAGGPLRYAIAAHRLIRRFQPDVVHAYFGPSSDILNELAPLHPKVRFVRTIGSTPIATRRGARFPALRRLKWRASLRNMDAVLCVAPHIRDMLRALGVDGDRLYVNANPTDVHRFVPRSDWNDPAMLQLLFLGRLDPIKNLGTMIRGVVLAGSGADAVPLRLTIYGRGPLEDALHRLVADLQADDLIQFAGRTDDVPAALAGAHVYLQASHHEGSPAAVAEALAAGLPVLLSDIPGHRQMIEDGVQGWFFDGAEPEALASACRRLWADRSRLAVMGAAARQRACDHFTMERWMEGETAVYAAVLGGRTAPRRDGAG